MAPREELDPKVQDPVSQLGPSTESTIIQEESTSVVAKNKLITAKKCLVVTFGCLMMMLTMGFLMGLGVLFVDIIDTFQSTRAKGSLIQSVCMGLIFGTGAFTSVIIVRVGAGMVCTVGGLIAAIGCAASAFAPNLSTLIVTVGVITGIGLCTTTMVPFILAGQVFDKKRHFSLTVVSIGPGIGTLVFPSLNAFLMEHFGWRGAFLILAGLVLQTCPIGMVLSILCKEILEYKEKRLSKSRTPLENVQETSLVFETETEQGTNLTAKNETTLQHVYDNVTFEHEDIKTEETTDGILTENNLNSCHQLSAANHHQASTNGRTSNCEPKRVEELNTKVKPSFLSNVRHIIETLHLGLFKEFSFLNLAVSVFILTALLPSINFFFVDMVKGRGFDLKTGSSLMSLIGLFSLAGRVLYLFVRPLFKFSQLTIFGTIILLISLTIPLLIWGYDYNFLLAAVACYGFTFGSASVAYPAVMFEVSGEKRYPMAVGYTETIAGIGGLLGGPIAGSLKDATGSYDGVYIGSMVACFLCSISFYCVVLKQNISRKFNKRNKKTECTHF